MATKYLKIGIQVCQIYDEEILRQRLSSAVEQKNVTLANLYHKPPIDLEALIAHVRDLGERIRPMVIDTTLYLHKALKEGKTVLLEGQLGSLRDPDHGIYPYTTSSSPLARLRHGGRGCARQRHQGCVLRHQGIFQLRRRGSLHHGAVWRGGQGAARPRGGDAGEYGATTGRPRRVGWFDAVATRYGCMVQGATEAVMTNLDVLGYLDQIPVCTAYEVDGKTITDFPSTPTLMRCKPVYTLLPGWKCDVRGVTEWDKLPENCQNYITFIEKELQVPIHMISTGPKREEMLYR